MFKAFRTLIVGLMLLTVLAACGASTAETPAAPSAAASTAAPSAIGSTAASAESSMTASESAATSATASGSAEAMASTTTEATMSGTETAGTETAINLPDCTTDKNVTATLNGSGSSFVNQIMQRWIQEYKSVVPGVTINYNSVGSGQGVKDFSDGITDFGATDAYLTDEELQKVPDALNIPIVSGAVVATYNLPGVEKLRFSPDTLANIFLGNIKTWNDAAIKADNPDLNLPNTPITVVYRSDGSGTNSIFTEYLSSVSSEFKQKVGAGKTVKWPVGQGAEKNDGVAQAVKTTEGAIGYVELIYALGNNLPAPAIKNAAGQFVEPSIESVTATAEGFLKDLPQDLRINIVNPPEGQNAYPISGFTWLLVHKEMKDQQKAKALTDFICWALNNGDQTAEQLRYAPLPAAVKSQAFKNMEQITVEGKPVFTPQQ